MTSDAATTPAELMTMFAARAARGDADGLLALYEPGAVLEAQPGAVLRGPAEILPALAELAELRPRIEYQGEADVVIPPYQAAMTPSGDTTRRRISHSSASQLSLRGGRSW